MNSIQVVQAYQIAKLKKENEALKRQIVNLEGYEMVTLPKIKDE